MQMLLESSIFCTQQVTNRQHSGKPPLREVTASLGPPSAALGGAAREQYAAMEAGGGAVEAPKKTQTKLMKRVNPGLMARDYGF